MPQQQERPRPQGDPLVEKITDTNPEDNPAQRQSDAPPDATGRDDVTIPSDRSGGRGSDANGIPEFDDARGEQRRKQYKDGAEIVSGID